MEQTIAALGRQVLDDTALDRPRICALLEAGLRRPYDLFYWANKVRSKHFGNRVSLCSIIPGRLGGCGEDCKWCAQSVAGTGHLAPPEYARLSDVQAAAGHAAACGAGCFCIVNSGRGPSQGELAAVRDATAALGREHGGQAGVAPGSMHIGASLGELTPQAAGELFAAGTRRYNHNLETSRRFYSRMVTTHSYDNRLATLRAAREAGMQLCCGGIFGLGETWDDRIDLALTLRDEVKPQMSPLNFLNAIPGTALEKQPGLQPMEILTIIAMFRMILPTVDLKIAGGRQVNLRDMQSWVFYVGGTSCLVGNYLTTFGRPVELDLQMLRDLGLEVVPDVLAAAT